MEVTGTIRVKEGYWYMVITEVDNYGKSTRKWYSTKLKEAKNKTKAKAMLNEKIEQIKLNYNESYNRMIDKAFEDNIKGNQILFIDYLTNYVHSKEGDLSAVVYHIYKDTYLEEIRKFYEKDELPIGRVKTRDIQRFYDHLRDKGLKENSIKRYSNIIRPALKKAKIEGLIRDNPHDNIPAFRRAKPQIHYYNKAELNMLLEVIEGNKYELPIKVAVYYGLRRSEIIGLRWQAIDFEHKTLTVNHKVEKVQGQFILSDKLKTESSNRTLPLFPEIEEDLRAQKKNIDKNKLYYGKGYNDTYSDYIFVDELGNLLNPDTLGHQFKKIIRRHKMPDIRFHDLRHSCASLMVANKVPIKQVQEWLGHANFATTADVYSHLDYSSKIDSANIITNSLQTSPVEQDAEIRLTQSSEEELNKMRKMIIEMNKLGITDVDEYIKIKKLAMLMNSNK